MFNTKLENDIRKKVRDYFDNLSYNTMDTVQVP